MDIVERLLGHAKNNVGGSKKLLELSAQEIIRLRQQNAELLKALKDMSGAGYAIVSIYRAAIAKATGGE